MRHALLAGAVVSAAAVVGLPSVATADDAPRTMTVCATDCDYTSIAAAVAAAAAGDTVRITEHLSVTGATAINKDVTITADAGVLLTQTGANARTFTVLAGGSGATISGIELTSATPVRGEFIGINGADDVTISRNTIYGPAQTGPMGKWVTNRAWTNNNVSGLAVTGNTFHTLRTGGYIDGGSGVISDNVTWNTKGDYLLADQADFVISGNSAGPADLPSEWSIVIFAVNETPYDVQALGAANECLSVWDQATDETFGSMYGHGDCDGDGIRDTPPPVSKDECKKGGWATFNNPSFRNQGQCVSSVAKQK
ncbi:hypothetical protein [Blastococcus sp. SYSU DS0539]